MSLIFQACAFLSAFLFFSGCFAQPRAKYPPRSPLGEGIGAFEAPGEGSGHRGAGLPVEPPGLLTLPAALALALARNSGITSASWSLRVEEARILQAGLTPNPEFEAAVSSLGGRGGEGGAEAPEVSLSLGQAIELGGKRSAAIRAAVLGSELAGWDYEEKRIEVLTGTTRAFAALVAAQEEKELSAELVRLAGEGLNAVNERVAAGKSASVESDKALVEFASSRIELSRAVRRIEAARRNLSLMWGNPDPLFERAQGALDPPALLPSAGKLERFLYTNPAAARWESELALKKAELGVAKAGAVPDVTIVGEAAYYPWAGDWAFGGGFSIPLPLFGRNQGEIAAARASMEKARESKRAAESELAARFTEAYQALSTAFEEASCLESEVIPAAKRVYEAAREGFEKGKTGYLEVVDAQRVLFELRRQLVGAKAAYLDAAASVEGLICRGLASAAD